MTSDVQTRAAALALAHDWFLSYSAQMNTQGRGPWIPTTEQFTERVEGYYDWLTTNTGLPK